MGESISKKEGYAVDRLTRRRLDLEQYIFFFSSKAGELRIPDFFFS